MMLRRARTSAADCAPVSSEWPALFAAAADTSTFALRRARPLSARHAACRAGRRRIGSAIRAFGAFGTTLPEKIR